MIKFNLHCAPLFKFDTQFASHQNKTHSPVAISVMWLGSALEEGYRHHYDIIIPPASQLKRWMAGNGAGVSLVPTSACYPKGMITIEFRGTKLGPIILTTNLGELERTGQIPCIFIVTKHTHGFLCIKMSYNASPSHVFWALNKWT